MKINKDDFGVLTNSTGETDFGIKNPAIIFDILCNRLYENPLKIVVQEYLANARDSHREAGCPDKPVTIICPTRIESTLKIRDYGVGISPDRMNNVFVYLGESTKNKDNDQNGGFGVGAKVAWAYTSSFNIHTVYNGVKYNYLAYIGEEGIGKLDLLSENSTDELNGTTIEVVINPNDYSNVSKHIKQITKFWKIQPQIKNGITSIQNSTEEYSDIKEDVTLVKIKGYYSDIPKGSINVTVDDIPYYNIQDKIDVINDAFYLPSAALFIHFKTGELDLAINRESLQYTDRTINNITKKLYNLKDYLGTNINKIISKHTNIKTMFADEDLCNSLYVLKTHDLLFRNIPLKMSNYAGQLEIIYNFFTSGPLVKRYSFNVYRNALKIDSMKSELRINKFNVDNVYFNDKYTKSVKNTVLKEYLRSKSLRNMWIIMPPNDLKGVFQTDIDNFDTLGIITNLSSIYNMIVTPLNNMNVIAYDGDSKNQICPLDEDYDPIYIQYKYVYQNSYITTSYKNFLEAYNKVHDTNYKLYVVTHANVNKLKKLKKFSCGVEWINNKKMEFLWNSDRDIIKAHILKNMIMSSDFRHITNLLSGASIYDPEINEYLKYTSENKLFHKTVDGDKLSLFSQSYNTYKAQQISKIDIMEKFYDKKCKMINSKEESIMKNYPLMDNLIHNTRSTSVVDYVNAIYETKIQRSIK